MALYETTFIIRQDISSNEVDKLTENYTNFINTTGGKVLKTENWGLRNLAYKVKKNRKGHYVMLVLDVSYDNLVEMERQMKLNENILKNVTIKIDEFDPEPSAMLDSKNSEEEETNQEVIKEVL